ncbi:hypothetical protein NBRC116493_22090 [Aurantivibrio infirmus]
MNNYEINSRRLEEVAVALDELLDEVVFIGGCTTVLLVDKAARFGVRQTDDVDAIINIATYVDYQRLSRTLRDKGFNEDIDGPMCRWFLPNSRTKLDIMPTDKTVLGFGNRWYPKVIESSKTITLPNNLEIKHVTSSLFLATKFEAFADRGKGDYFSRDLEDIIFVLENSAGLIQELVIQDQEIREYLAQQAKELMNDKFFNLLPGLLENKHSIELVLQRLDDMARL